MNTLPHRENFPLVRNTSGIEAIIELYKNHPELHTRKSLNKFREKMITILNHFLKTKELKPHLNGDFSDKEKSYENTLHKWLNLGSDIIIRKKGNETLLRLLKNNELDKIIALARKQLADTANQLKNLDSNNRSGIELDIDEGDPIDNPYGFTDIPLSECVEDIRHKYGENDYSTLEGLEKMQKEIQKAEQMLQIAKILEIAEDSCHYGFEHSGVKALFSNQFLNFKFLELGVFVNVFCNLIGSEVEFPLWLTPEQQKKLLQRIVIEKKENSAYYVARWENDFEKSMIEICEKMFPQKEEVSTILLLKFMEKWMSFMNFQGQHLEEGLKISAEMNCPSKEKKTMKSKKRKKLQGDKAKPINREVQASSSGSSQQISKKKLKEKETEAKALDLFFLTIDQFLELPNEAKERLVRTFPLPGYWSRMLLDRSNPQKTEQLLTTLLEYSESLVKNCIFTLITLEPDIKNTANASEILKKGKNHLREKKEDLSETDEEYFVKQVFELLPTEIHMEILNSAVFEHLNSEDLLEEIVELHEKNENDIIEHNRLALPKYWHSGTDEHELCDLNNPDNAVRLLKTIDQSEKKKMMLCLYSLNKSDQYWDSIVSSILLTPHTSTLLLDLSETLPENLIFEILLRKIFLIYDNSNRIVDMPISAFINEKKGKYEPPKSWDMGCVLFGSLLGKVNEFCLKRKELRISDVVAELKGFQQEEICTALTDQKELDDKDIKSIQEIYKHDDDEKTLRVLLAKVLSSPVEIQKKAIRSLPLRDSVRLFFAVIGHAALQKNDKKTKVCDISQDDQSITFPQGYETFNDTYDPMEHSDLISEAKKQLKLLPQKRLIQKLK